MSNASNMCLLSYPLCHFILSEQTVCKWDQQLDDNGVTEHVRIAIQTRRSCFVRNWKSAGNLSP